MRIALIILIGIHGLIHLFGFLKAFELSSFDAINQSISKTSGLFWLLAFILFAITAVTIAVQSDYWWIFGISAVIVSQILIFGYWSDAKYGTIANAIILSAAVVSFSYFNFKQIVQRERIALLEQSEEAEVRLVRKDDISTLPPPVQQWLINSKVVGKSSVSTVYLTQELDLKLKPEQTEWYTGTAEQYFSIQPPAFNWTTNIKLNSLLSVVGRDKFKDGKGEMLIKLLATIPIANAKNHEKVDQATLQRYLGEMVWFPSAALSPYIKWDPIDDRSAKATLEYGGTKGSGVFHFDENGHFKKFVAMRYKDKSEPEPTEWIVSANKIEERNGIKIPTNCEVSWKLDNGDWTWAKLRINHIEYNIDTMPVPDKVYKR